MQIRPRERDDLSRLETIARAVRASDGYPLYMDGDDFAGLLDTPEMIAAWVAVVDDNIVGQVSLHSVSSTEVMALAVARLGVAVDQLGVVARLLVDPSSRRAGVAQALLKAAEQDALDRGLVPILDVVDRFAPAIALYERQGWTRLGTVSIDLPDDTSINEHVYAAPSHSRVVHVTGLTNT